MGESCRLVEARRDSEGKKGSISSGGCHVGRKRACREADLIGILFDSLVDLFVALSCAVCSEADSIVNVT